MKNSSSFSDGTLSSDAVREALERILASADFVRSRQLSRFLRYIVEKTLEGQAEELKAYTIAIGVLDRSTDFDPQFDPLVRVRAGRLRRALERYYLTNGASDPIRIEVPKGGYVPYFHLHMADVAHVETEPEVPTVSQEPSSLPPSPAPSILVLPLVNLNKDEELDYFTYGLGEELSLNLALIQGLTVISHYSAMHYNRDVFDLRRIGEELKAEYIVTGSIYRGSERLRVVMQLNHSPSGQQLWGHRYDIALSGTDLLELQEDVTRQLVATITGYYGAFSQTLWKASRGKPVNELTAYEAVLWHHYYVLTLSFDVWQPTKEALEYAVRIEPEYALAWAMLSTLYGDMYAMFMKRERELLERAKSYAHKAVSLDPHCQHAHYAICFVSLLEKDYPQVIRSAERIIELNPNSAFMLGAAGQWLALADEWEQGIRYIEHSIRLNPFYPKWFHGTYFLYHYRKGNYEHALDESHQYNFPHVFWSPLFRAAVLGQLGRHEEARAACDALLKLVPDFVERMEFYVDSYGLCVDIVEGLIDGLNKAGIRDNI